MLHRPQKPDAEADPRLRARVPIKGYATSAFLRARQQLRDVRVRLAHMPAQVAPYLGIVPRQRAQRLDPDVGRDVPLAGERVLGSREGERPFARIPLVGGLHSSMEARPGETRSLEVGDVEVRASRRNDGRESARSFLPRGRSPSLRAAVVPPRQDPERCVDQGCVPCSAAARRVFAVVAVMRPPPRRRGRRRAGPYARSRQPKRSRTAAIAAATHSPRW